MSTYFDFCGGRLSLKHSGLKSGNDWREGHAGISVRNGSISNVMTGASMEIAAGSSRHELPGICLRALKLDCVIESHI